MSVLAICSSLPEIEDVVVEAVRSNRWSYTGYSNSILNLYNSVFLTTLVFLALHANSELESIGCSVERFEGPVQRNIILPSCTLFFLRWNFFALELELYSHGRCWWSLRLLVETLPSGNAIDLPRQRLLKGWIEAPGNICKLLYSSFCWSKTWAMKIPKDDD